MLERELKARDHKIALLCGFSNFKLEATGGEPDTMYYKGSQCFFVERKRFGGKPRINQSAYQAKIINEGGYAYIIDDIDNKLIVLAMNEVSSRQPPIIAAKTFFKFNEKIIRGYIKDGKPVKDLKRIGLLQACGKETNLIRIIRSYVL